MELSKKLAENSPLDRKLIEQRIEYGKQCQESYKLQLERQYKEEEQKRLRMEELKQAREEQLEKERLEEVGNKLLALIYDNHKNLLI